MLGSGQLENVGFSYILSLTATSSPYGAELARRPPCFTPDEHCSLLREFARIRTAGRVLQETPEAFARIERALMQLKDVRRTLRKCAACRTVVRCETTGTEASCCEQVNNAPANRKDMSSTVPEAENHGLTDSGAECDPAAERLYARYAGDTSDDTALSDVEFFELKRFLIGLEELVNSYLNAFGMGLEGLEIRDFPDALDIIDPDGMRALTFRVSSICSAPLAAIRDERRRVELAIRQMEDAAATRTVQKTVLNASTSENATGTEDADALTRLINSRTRLAADEDAEEARIRRVMTALLSRYAGDMLPVCQSIAELDLALAKARLLVRYNAAIPTVSTGTAVLELRGMTNPMLDAALRERGRSFVPTDITLSPGSTVITGANMGGKSVALKTLALNVRLALSGFPVFCDEAVIPHFADIHLLCEELEDSRSGLSSFGGQMAGFDAILRACHNKAPSLVLLDEFARGTNPYEGSTLVRAAVRYFNAAKGVYALITTHFDDVAALANAHYQVTGLRNADKNALTAAIASCEGPKTRVIESFMDYGLYRASADAEPPRDAFIICHALNVPEDFMRLAEHERTNDTETSQEMNNAEALQDNE